MNSAKKIELQKNKISRLEKENQQLQEQITKLNIAMIANENEHSNSFLIAKKMIVECEAFKKEYEKCIQDALTAKNSYFELLDKLKNETNQYKKNMNSFLNKFRREHV